MDSKDLHMQLDIGGCDVEKRPNIIFILTDDQGMWALHCAGNEEIHTPNLDRLAAGGVRFENFFCASPVCSPARASILTGRIPSQHGVHDWLRSGSLDREKLGKLKDHPYYASESKAVPYLSGMLTYTDILEKYGYQCALSGKWHLGDSINPQHGFSRWFTIGRGGCMYYQPDIVLNGEVCLEDRYVTDLITEKALQFMDEMGKTEEPYYLSIHYTAPHDPWDEDQHPKEFIDLYRNCKFHSVPELPIHENQIPSAPVGQGERRKELLRGYYAAITAMDAGVGRILDSLQERGELEDTLIFFMSDNGMNMGHHGIWGKGNGTFPPNFYDTSVKVPFIVSWPKVIPGGRVTQSMCSQYDFMQTLLELLGISEELPDNLPGRSFRDVLFGREKDEETAVVIFDEYGPNRMIRTREWKFIHHYPYGPDELYHLSKDAGETINLSGREEVREIEEQLMKRLIRWFDKYADPKMDAVHEGVTGFGQLRRCGYYSEGKKIYSEIPKQ